MYRLSIRTPTMTPFSDRETRGNLCIYVFLHRPSSVMVSRLAAFVFCSLYHTYCRYLVFSPRSFYGLEQQQNNFKTVRERLGLLVMLLFRRKGDPFSTKSIKNDSSDRKTHQHLTDTGLVSKPKKIHDTSLCTRAFRSDSRNEAQPTGCSPKLARTLLHSSRRKTRSLHPVRKHHLCQMSSKALLRPFS